MSHLYLKYCLCFCLCYSPLEHYPNFRDKQFGWDSTTLFCYIWTDRKRMTIKISVRFWESSQLSIWGGCYVFIQYNPWNILQFWNWFFVSQRQARIFTEVEYSEQLLTLAEVSFFWSHRIGVCVCPTYDWLCFVVEQQISTKAISSISHTWHLQPPSSYMCKEEVKIVNIISSETRYHIAIIL